MKPLRISIVQYLNTAPLIRGFTHGPLRAKYELSFTVPSRCAEALRTAAVDVAIIPAIEYQRIDNLVALPNLSISSKRSVRSLSLISRKPMSQVTRIALDRSSRSTQVLVRILCAKRWAIAPEFYEADPDLRSMLANADAALLIGDPALRLALTAEAAGALDDSGNRTCPGTALGLSETSAFSVYDVVEEWHSMTDLPAVLAVWAARSNVVTPELIRDFQDSLAYGMNDLDNISAEASQPLSIPASKLRRYLVENIDYSLDKENLRGLRRYFELAAELGLLSQTKEIEVAGHSAAAIRPPEFEAASRR